MNSIDTVYVIGAGASVPYGMPTGPQLKDQILAAIPEFYERHRIMDENQGALLELEHNFKMAPMASIDAFLVSRPHLSSEGKLLISECILNAELESNINKQNIDGDWLTYLFNHLELNRFPERLDKVAFVSFNYDRLIERFFYHASISAYNDPMILKPNIIRIHGSLGDYNHQEFKLYRNQGKYPYLEIAKAAGNLKIVHDEGENNEADEAKNVIANASRVFFLGLSYAPDNIKKIWPPENKRSCPLVYFAGSAYKMEDAEITNIPYLPQETVGVDIGSSVVYENVDYGNSKEDCLMLLRRYGALPKIQYPSIA